MQPPTLDVHGSRSPPLENYWITITASRLGLTLDVLSADLSGGVVGIYSGSPASPVFVTNITGALNNWILASSTIHMKFDVPSTFEFAAAYASSYKDDDSTLACGLTSVNHTSGWGEVVHRSDSFLFSDGSTSRPLPLQKCKFIVSPKETREEVVLSFSRMNLPSSNLEVWDGNDRLLFGCYSCKLLPSNLGVTSNAAKVIYWSDDAAEISKDSNRRGGAGRLGWEVMYRSVEDGGGQEGRKSQADGWEMLRMAKYMDGDFNKTGMDWIWNIELGPDQKKAEEVLKMGKTVGKPCDLGSGGARLKDRSSGAINEVQSFDIMKTCGFVKHKNVSAFQLEGYASGSEMTVLYRNDRNNSGAHLRRFYGRETTNYYRSGNGGRASTNAEPTCMQDFKQFKNVSDVALAAQGYNKTVGSVPVSSLCQYRVTTMREDSWNLTLSISSMKMPAGISLGVFAGSSELGKPLFLCGREYVFKDRKDSIYSPYGPVPKPNIFSNPEGMSTHVRNWWKRHEYFKSLHSYSEFCGDIDPLREGARKSLSLKSTCGKIYIRFVHNETLSVARGWDESNLDNIEFEGKFKWIGVRKSSELGKPWHKCFDNPEYEPEPIVIEESALTKALILFGYVVAVVAMIAAMAGSYWYLEIYKPNQQIQLNKPKYKKAKKIPHATYTPILNSLMNRTLKVGECTICFGEEKCFRLPGCKHEVCVDCLRSYVHTALGDASMFPIKCPMHHMGCLTVLESKFSQRVLNKDEFERFNLFNDRAVYGDGMACIFCGNFVIFPERMGGVMVACPYCRQRFCMKCKVAWHVGVDCTDQGKDELEDWRKAQGATRCPGCYKIIEKDDPETCNHMVHKVCVPLPSD